MTTTVVIYCVLVGLLFLCLWLYYDHRDHARFEEQRGRATFHCIRCDRIYEAKAGSELCHCPHCGHENTRLKF